MNGGTNLPRVGGYNQAVVLDAIRIRGPVSRVELAPLTGLTNQTVSNVVRRLLAAGLVAESGFAPSGGGKRRTLLAPRPDGAFAAGVHLDPHAVVVAVVDLVGGVRASTRIALEVPSDPEDVVRRVSRALRRLTTRARIPADRLLGVGVAAPGPIDSSEGAVVHPPNLPGWQLVPLVRMLEEATGMSVAMENDATAAAIGERWIGGRERGGSFLFLYLGTGIGAGLVLGGTVIHGDTGNAGEFGHMSVQDGGLTCHCGNTDCLGPYLKRSAVIADYLAAIGPEEAAAVGARGVSEEVDRDWALLLDAVRRADPAAVDAVRRSGRRLGQAARSAVSLLDVGAVVLGGDGLTGIDRIMCEEVDAAVNGAAATGRPVRPVSVERSVMGETVGAVGAASLVLHGNYAPGWRMLTEA